jgi:hypothetical protein
VASTFATWFPLNPNSIQQKRIVFQSSLMRARLHRRRFRTHRHRMRLIAEHRGPCPPRVSTLPDSPNSARPNRNNRLVGMVSVSNQAPFSVSTKLNDPSILNPSDRPCWKSDFSPSNSPNGTAVPLATISGESRLPPSCLSHLATGCPAPQGEAGFCIRGRSWRSQQSSHPLAP